MVGSTGVRYMAVAILLRLRSSLDELPGRSGLCGWLLTCGLSHEVFRMGNTSRAPENVDAV